MKPFLYFFILSYSEERLLSSYMINICLVKYIDIFSLKDNSISYSYHHITIHNGETKSTSDLLNRDLEHEKKKAPDQPKSL